LIRALRMKGAARRATDRALSPMTGKGPKRYGVRIPSGAMTGEPDRKTRLYNGLTSGRLRSVRNMVVLDEDGVVQLLRSEIARAGGPMAYSKKARVDRSTVHRTLKREERPSRKIIRIAPGHRRPGSRSRIRMPWAYCGSRTTSRERQPRRCTMRWTVRLLAVVVRPRRAADVAGDRK
jgi:hypothetical protein